MRPLDGFAFKSLLQVNGCSVTLVNRTAAGAFNYSPYNMIVIGGNTDTLGAPYSHWPSPDAMTINNTGKPILLLNGGGLLFATAVQDTVNWGSSAGNILPSFKATDPTSVLYKQPNAISIGSDSIVTIYSAASKVISFFAKSKPVHNVALIGQEDDAPASRYYPITMTNSRYTQFGFYANPNALTATGKSFFVNLVYFAGNLTL